MTISGAANAAASIATKRMRVRSRPSFTASVRLPARRSVSTSRPLLTTRIAAASSPTGTESANASQVSSSVCT